MSSKLKVFVRSSSLLAISFFLSTGLFAQHHPQRQGPPVLPDSARIVEMVDELAQSIALDETQKAAITDLHFEHFEEVKAKMKQNKENREAHHREMERLRREFEGEINQHLTDEQKAKFESFIVKHKPERNVPMKKH